VCASDALAKQSRRVVRGRRCLTLSSRQLATALEKMDERVALEAKIEETKRLISEKRVKLQETSKARRCRRGRCVSGGC
jgi:hypothetical protein